MTGASENSRIFATEDARRIARRRLPRLIYDFIEGGVADETAVAENRAAFDRVKLQPRVLRQVAERDLSKTFLGQTYRLPFGIAPMGMCNLAHPKADDLLARMALTHGIPVCLSTVGSTTIEDMARLSEGTAWFQLYVGQTQEAGFELSDRAAAAGYETLVLTVDVPQVSRRVRDLRNGFKIPFKMGVKQFLDFATHPLWSLPMLKAGAPAPVNFGAGGGNFARGAPRAGADWDFLGKLRDRWKGKLIVKGVTSPEDAARIASMGADSVIVSNHGARQIDSGPGALTALGPVREAVGSDYPLIFDSGIRTGDDVVRALALGADFVLVGRPWLFALGAEGERGLFTLADVLAQEIGMTLAQIGVPVIEDITSDVLVEVHRDRGNS